MKFEEWKELMRQQWKELAEKRREGMTHSEIHNHESQLGMMSKNDPEYGQTYTITYNVTGNVDTTGWPTEIKSARTLKLNIPIPYGATGSVDANTLFTYDNGVFTIEDVQQDIEITVNVTDVLYENAKLGDYLYSDWTFGPTEKAGYLGRCVGRATENEGKSVWCSKQSSSERYWSTEDKNTGINDFANANAAKTDFGGKANTELLLSLGKDKYPAAKWASEQFQGNGYLPAVGELYKCCAEIKLYVYSGVVYSSTEKDSASAWTTSTTNKSVGNKQKRAYSYRIVSFLQLSGKLVDIDFNNNQYVDLGLPSGTKWATMNVGATSETDVGLYFQWGDIQGYTVSQVGSGDGQKLFNRSDYKFNQIEDDQQSLTKYNDSDKKYYLDSEDDAASYILGGDWKIPTKSQIQELYSSDNCTMTMTTKNNTDGCLFVSKINGAELFIPASGMVFNADISDRDECFIHTNECNPYSYNTFIFDKSSGGTGFSTTPRWYGAPVRGIVSHKLSL